MSDESAKAGGGARHAALDVIAGLFNDDPLAPKLAGWAHDALQLCTRSLRSSGSGEPSFRVSAMKMACAVAKACRISFDVRSSFQARCHPQSPKLGTSW